jgi:subtilisin-like proprotein convertase family protein
MHTPIATFAVIAASVLVPIAGAESITLTSDAPAAIPDLGEAFLVLPAAPVGNPIVESVTVDIDLAHAWIGDLVITLEHDGVVVRLVDRIASATMPFACGGEDINATFEDGAAITPDDLCWPGPTPTIYGTVAPVDALAAFAGLAAGGDWTVRVQDAANYDSGIVNSATVRIVLAPPTACIGDVNGDSATNAADFTVLAGNFGASVDPGTSGDLNGDGVVDAADFVILAGDFGCTLAS